MVGEGGSVGVAGGVGAFVLVCLNGCDEGVGVLALCIDFLCLGEKLVVGGGLPCLQLILGFAFGSGEGGVGECKEANVSVVVFLGVLLILRFDVGILDVGVEGALLIVVEVLSYGLHLKLLSEGLLIEALAEARLEVSAEGEVILGSLLPVVLDSLFDLFLLILAKLEISLESFFVIGVDELSALNCRVGEILSPGDLVAVGVSGGVGGVVGRL